MVRTGFANGRIKKSVAWKCWQVEAAVLRHQPTAQSKEYASDCGMASSNILC
jgi:hypothetical protein